MKTPSVFALLLLCVTTTGASAQGRSLLIPDFAVVQYADSLGYASVGVGYGLTKKIRGSLHYGFVPESKGGSLYILSTKFLFSPWTTKLNETFQLQPFDIGIMATYHFGDNFHDRWPSRYPDGYYWWTSSTRFHLVAESSATYLIPASRSFFKSVSGYIEFNTNDLYVVSFVQNTRSISFFDIVKSGVGMRVRF